MSTNLIVHKSFFRRNTIRALLLSCMSAAISILPLYAQRLPVNVNPLTGTPSLSIPIDRVVSGDLIAPVSLIYQSKGIMLGSQPGSAGAGWDLNAGGQVSRQVRGLPDDVQQTQSSTPALGWLYNTNGAKIINFAIANDGNPATCSDEQADVNYINSNFGDHSDTEPDVFSVNAPGLSCQFVFDNNHVIRTIPFRDVQISYALDASGQIANFTAVNDKGTKYSFTQTVQATKKTKAVLYYPSGFPTEDIRYFKTRHEQYKYGINYASSWLLTGMTDANGNQVSFGYQDKGIYTDPSNSSYQVGSEDNTASYTITETHRSISLISIEGGGTLITFQYANNTPSQSALIKNITTRGVNYQFNYSAPITQSGQTYLTVTYLRSVTTDQCNSPVNYRFTYEGETMLTSMPEGYIIPPYSNEPIKYDFADPWGYTTGQRSTTPPSAGNTPVNPTVVMTGMLKQIQYYDNGSTTLVYESNDFIDPLTSGLKYGGGARVKQITDDDGTGGGNNIVRNYAYINPTTQASSGIPLSLPKFNFANTSTTVATENDLTEEDHSILYSHVRESRSGQGSTLYEYQLPAMAGDTGSPLGDWAPTMSYAARTNCGVSNGALTNTQRIYPFAPDPNYDFERGLIKQITAFNEGGAKVSQSVYTYQRSSTPVQIQALRIDDNDQAKVYSKYLLLTSSDELSSQVTTKIFDSPGSTQSHQTTVTYNYNGNGHIYPTSEETLNSDGALTKVNYAYTKDYNTGLGYDNHLLLLQQRGINVSYETYAQVKPAGSNFFKTVSASLTKYGDFYGRLFPGQTNSAVNILPSQTLQLVSANGLTDFQPSATGDPRYRSTTSFVTYTPTGYLKYSVNNTKQRKTAIIDSFTHQPLAIFNNAAPQEIGFSNFDYGEDPAQHFIVSTNNYQAVPDRSGKFGIRFNASGTLSRAIAKATSAKRYILSLWLQSASAGALNISVAGTSVQNYPLAYTALASEWKYYEISLPVAGLPANLTISVAAGSGVAVDDLLLYPEEAEVKTFSYDQVTQQSLAETSTNGVSTYYDRDKFGRILLAYDQDRNIILRKSYNYQYFGLTIPEPIFYRDVPITSDAALVNINYNFLTYNTFNSCQLPGATFSWNYGDGSAATTNFNHTFTQPGTYNVSLTVSVPGFGSKTATDFVKVIAAPPPMVHLGYANTTTQSGLNRVDFLQNNQVVYSIAASNLSSTTIPQGSYTVKVYCNGMDTGISVVGEADSVSECQNWSHSNIYTYQVSLTSGFYVYLNPSACGQ